MAAIAIFTLKNAIFHVAYSPQVEAQTFYDSYVGQIYASTFYM